MLKNDAITQIPQVCIFQQDGAPPHYSSPVKAFLSQQFPGRWIGRRGSYHIISQITRFDFFRFLCVGAPKELGVPNKGAGCGQTASADNCGL
jgi:hypothetical protein